MTEHWHVDTTAAAAQSHSEQGMWTKVDTKYTHTLVLVLYKPLVMVREWPDVLTGSLQLATTAAHRQRGTQRRLRHKIYDNCFMDSYRDILHYIYMTERCTVIKYALIWYTGSELLTLFSRSGIRPPCDQSSFFSDIITFSECGTSTPF